MSFFDTLKEKFAKKKDGDRYLSGFNKTSDTMGKKLNKMSFGFNGVTDEFLEELMIVLLESDVGIQTAEKICDQLKQTVSQYRYVTFKDVMAFLMEIMQNIYLETPSPAMTFNTQGPTVILMVGVNGSGKTTTCAKLTRLYQSQGKSVALAAADTFRAGAIEQLERWAQRLGVPCIRGKENSDPSSVLVDACRYAKEHQIDILLCDTAGRLQNKVNLMNELAKMRKVIGREIEGAPHHVWLVLDATTGQNGLSQARIFQEVTDVTGIVLTKMDGTAKGGIVLAIKDVLHIPVIFLGLGEKEDDLKPFDLDLYLYSISEGIRDVG